MDAFARRLLRWFDQHGRHDLPWQHPRTPYRVWVSEVMLQQTQVATVIPYFRRFLDALPNLPALAAADADRVLALWSGLGYYRRARQLHAAARRCMELYAGTLPRDYAALVTLPGIGPSTAGAILALAHDQPAAILDGNVKRVLCRYHGVAGWPGRADVAATLWRHARSHTPSVRSAAYTQALMDLGATVCTPVQPRCDRCPLARTCSARRHGTTATLPEARPRRILPTRKLVFVILRDRRGRVLLERRPPQGVWPGLWSLPEAPNVARANALAASLADLGTATASALPDVRHAFTHFRLQATPLLWEHAGHRARVGDAPDLRWYTRAELASVGLPAPIRRLLAG